MNVKQYRLRYMSGVGHTMWVDYAPTAPPDVDLDVFDAIEFRDKPAPCEAVAPFKVEGDEIRCERWDAAVCVADGYHRYDLVIEGGDYYGGNCYHEPSITWDVAG